MSEPVTRAGSDAVSAAVDEARALYAARRPRTSALHDRAQAFLPGGNTRSVLYHRPFPLRIARAWEAVLEDADGHEYVDLLGEYSAGLYGHSHPVVIKAMAAALHEGISRGGHTRYEVDLAEAICTRFASIERVRFTNSGSEAHLMALSRPGHGLPRRVPRRPADVRGRAVPGERALRRAAGRVQRHSGGAGPAA
jgi:glutamate-1-semialdehyde 2,1-aminomutase